MRRVGRLLSARHSLLLLRLRRRTRLWRHRSSVLDDDSAACLLLLLLLLLSLHLVLQLLLFEYVHLSVRSAGRASHPSCCAVDAASASAAARGVR